MNWPDLLYVLAKRAGMDISVEDVDSMSSEQKHELLCSDPVTTARHFSQRFQKFIAFMKSSSKPIGEVVDYFWQIEFQLRESPHVHLLWWVKDAPDLQLLRVCVLCLASLTSTSLLKYQLKVKTHTSHEASETQTYRHVSEKWQTWV